MRHIQRGIFVVGPTPTMRKLFYSFTLVLVLLGVFLTLWWRQAYQKDLATLRDHVEMDANRMVSEDFVWGTLQAMMLRAGELKLHNVIRRKNGPTGFTYRIDRIYRNRFGAPHDATITILRGREVLAEAFFIFEDRTIMLNQLPGVVRDSIRNRYGVVLENMPPGFVPRKFRRGALEVRVRHLVNDNKYDAHAFQMSHHRQTVLRGLIPEFVFGLLLFGATCFAFRSTYVSLRQQRWQLRQKDALVANIAHELKTPIATVGVALEALNAFGADHDPTRRREYLHIGNAELARLNQMADRAIDSLAAGDLAQRLNPQPTDLTTAVRDAWRGLSLRYELPDEALQLHVEGEVTHPVDPHYWYHLVYNLLDNACKYGGRPLEIRVTLKRHAGRVELTVSDNGPGVPAPERAKIFERFYRVTDHERGHAAKGHGLGLTFVRQIAHAHGGEVSVDRGEMGGARFTVRV